MSIPASLLAAVQAFGAALTANAPLKSLPRLQLGILQRQASALVAQVDTALAGAGGPLDAGDPTGFVGDFIDDLLGLAEASVDQEKLTNVRGYLGRATFNINQVYS